MNSLIKPLTKVIEQPVKPANIPGEQYSLTQPRSVEMPQIGLKSDYQFEAFQLNEVELSCIVHPEYWQV
jgi:outer membrane protease